MGKKVDRWIADDGTEFQDQKSMLLYEMAQVDAKEIEVFLREKFSERGSRRNSEYKKLLIEWQAYMRENSPQMTIQSVTVSEPVSFDQEVQEWVPSGGYILDSLPELDENEEIERSFKKATKI